MDDLHFRRSIYADPSARDDALIDAIANDPAKQKFVKDIEILDEKIAQALDIPIPEELCAKLILRQTLASHQQQKRKSRIRLAMAASVAFVLGLTVNFMMFSSSYQNLGDYAIAHVNHEAELFSNTNNANVSLTSLNNKMSAFNGSFASTLGQLIFADYCRFDGMKSLHLVFQGENSPVNIFIVPKNEALTFSANFANEKLQGRSLKFKHSNVIVVGDKTESLQHWQDKITTNVSWSI